MFFSSKLKRIWDAVTTVIVILAVIFALLLVGARLFGVRVYSVVSGSMEPEYPVGSLIYVKQVTPSEVKVGDVITFVLSNNTPATHRVIDIDSDAQLFYTQGDANFRINEETGEKEFIKDAPVHFNNLIGKPVFKIPLLGYAAYYIQHPPGTYIAIAAGAVLLILVFLPDIFKKNVKKDENSPEENGDSTKG